MKKLIPVIITLALALCLCLFLIHDKTEAKANANRLAELNSQMISLNSQIDALTAEKEELEGKDEASSGGQSGTGEITILFTDLSADIYTKALPIMKELSDENCNFTGTLAVSYNFYPWYAGRLTTQQYNELMENGWSSCLIWDNNDCNPNTGFLFLFDNWYGMMRNRMVNDGFAFPDTVYFDNGHYDPQLAAKLSGLGAKNIIHNGEENMSTEKGVSDEATGLYYVGSINYKDNTEDILKSVIEADGEYALRVAFKDFDEAGFKAQLEMLKPYVESGNLKIVSVDAAREGLEGTAETEETLSEKEIRLAQIDNELASLRSQLESVMSSY